MAAAAPNPNSNLLLLAVIGIGAYYLMTRRATAAPLSGYAGAGSAQAMENAARYNLIGSGLNSLTRLIGGISGGGSQPNPIVWDNLTNDGYAVNPAGATSAWDWWTRSGTAGD